MYKRIFLLFLSACFFISGISQTVVWQMKPRDYHQIERIGRNLFKVVQNGKIGLISADGTIVAPIINDDIGGYYEHKALLLCSDGHGERIIGCLTDNSSYYGYTTKYYTLNGQKFFSDGVITVADEKGNLGYIDEKGNQIIGFDGKYSRIKPFTEGYATVMKNKKYVLIDKDGEEMKFVYGKGVGAAIAGCTNVYNGQAYVYDEYGGSDRSYFLYNAKEKGTLVKTNRVKNTAMDYLYCYQFVSGRTKDVPFEEIIGYSGVKGLAPIYTKGVYGFVSDGIVIVPEQFSFASQFDDGMAIVSINGQMGILKYIDGGGFGVSVPTPKYDFYVGNSVSCSFILTIPSVWKGKIIDVMLRNMDGVAVETTNTADSYAFSTKPSSSGQVDYFITISAEGLLLYEGKITYYFNKRERCSTCGKDKSLCEYKGNHPIPTPKCPVCGKKISECKYRGVH